DRLVEGADAVRDQRERERDREADRHGDQRQLDVLDQVRLEGVAPVLPHPVPAEDVVAGHAGAAVAEGGDDGAGGGQEWRREVAWSSVRTPTGAPSSPTTSTSPVPLSSNSETAFLTVADAATVAVSGV